MRVRLFLLLPAAYSVLGCRAFLLMPPVLVFHPEWLGETYTNNLQCVMDNCANCARMILGSTRLDDDVPFSPLIYIVTTLLCIVLLLPFGVAMFLLLFF